MFNAFFPKLFRLWDNVEKYTKAGQATDNNTAQRITCSIAQATCAHSEYATLIAYPLQQQWLHERTSFLRYT